MDLNKLLLVIPVCEADRELAQLRASKLAIQNVDVLFVFDKSLSSESEQAVLDAHKLVFKNVTTLKLQDVATSPNWPHPQNNMFQRVAQHLEWNVFPLKKYLAFYFFEPDVAPLKPNFLEVLWEQFLKNRKSYMGFVSPEPIKDSNGKVLWRYMNGAGFYPLNLIKRTPTLFLAQSAPWDVYIGNIILSEVTEANDSMAHNFGVSELKGTKDNWSAKQTLHGANGANILKEITGSLSDHHVVHHGCKDGSIYELLPKEDVKGVTEPEPSVKRFGPSSLQEIKEPVSDTVLHLPGFAPYPLGTAVVSIYKSEPNIFTKLKDAVFGSSVKVEVLPISEKEGISNASVITDTKSSNTTISVEEGISFADPIEDETSEVSDTPVNGVTAEEFEALREKQRQRRKKRLAKQNDNSPS